MRRSLSVRRDGFGDLDTAASEVRPNDLRCCLHVAVAGCLGEHDMFLPVTLGNFHTRPPEAQMVALGSVELIGDHLLQPRSRRSIKREVKGTVTHQHFVGTRCFERPMRRPDRLDLFSGQLWERPLHPQCFERRAYLEQFERIIGVEVSNNRTAMRTLFDKAFRFQQPKGVTYRHPAYFKPCSNVLLPDRFAGGVLAADNRCSYLIEQPKTCRFRSTLFYGFHWILDPFALTFITKIGVVVNGDCKARLPFDGQATVATERASL